MSGFFNPDNWLWKFFGKAFDFFGLSCMWLLSSMFIVTVGPASIACYDAAAHCLWGKEPNLAKRFFSTLKRELVPGILITLIWGVIFFVLWTGFQIIGQMGQPLLKVVYYFSMLVPVGALCWLIPIQSRFVYKIGQIDFGFPKPIVAVGDNISCNPPMGLQIDSFRIGTGYFQFTVFYPQIPDFRAAGHIEIAVFKRFNNTAIAKLRRSHHNPGLS